MKKAKAGANALKQIKIYQRSTELLMAKAPFARLVREVMERALQTLSAPEGVPSVA